MNKTFFGWGFFFLLILGAGALVVFYSRTPLLSPPENALYRNSSVSMEERIEDLLSYMTLEEKIAQMALVEIGSVHDADVADYSLGGLLSGGSGKPEENTPAGWRKMIYEFDARSRDSRLGIPVLFGVDANHGHGNTPGATIFPHFIGLGAAGDPELVYRIAHATSEEIQAMGIYWSYSPTLDLPEDIRWGRVYESFSDDPTRTGSLGAAYIRGLQAHSGERISVLATPKHFIGAGGMVWDSSRNENFRIDQGVIPPDEEKLRKVLLPPFEEAIGAGVQSVMVGLGSWGEENLAESEYLIRDILKGELGFKGFVVSDWYGVYEISESKYDSVVRAINAGVDMVMLPFDYKMFIDDVKEAVRRGDIVEARIDDAVRRILRAKFSLGLFEKKFPDKEMLSQVGSEAHRVLAREAVAKSLVLLKNENGVLPLSKDTSRIYVAGSAADNAGMQAGGWTIEWQGIDGNWLPGATSILAGIRQTVSSSTVMEYATDGNFEGKPIADVGIAVVGEKPYAEGWGDQEYPAVSAEDLDAIKNLASSSRSVVVVLVSGRPLFITKEIEKWDALVAAWLPGSEGAGVADVLFGEKPFIGTLPLPWPRHEGQLPINVDGVTRDGTSALFPRGFGLE